ncbi:2-hydroxyacid dehydrogenase [Atopobacter phocae]|uniref:2-hydroxyacid dehydrogenase n=1 Tax=Atopobacter phocae TaxID=136492 RepID=UPI00046EA6F1|nr:2-hydroxyacid dehydrogenase [Atopobacter phocae]
MKVVLLEPLKVPDERIQALAQPIQALGHEFVYYNQRTTDPKELAQRSAGADVVIIGNTPYPTEVIDQIESLKCIDVAFTGVDHIGISQAKNQDIMVLNAAGYANQAVAELVIGLTLSLYRQIGSSDQDTRQAEQFPGPFQGSEIKGKTVGIVGVGKIGLMTAKLFQAFGARVIGTSPHPSEEARQLGIAFMPLEELMQQADIVSLHTPLIPSTRRLISKEKLALMKKSAILINCARGPVVDNEALAEALNTGQIAGAGIDVYGMEPPIPSDYPLLYAKRAILTPHIAYLSNESMELRAQIAFDNAVAFLNGHPQNVVSR